MKGKILVAVLLMSAIWAVPFGIVHASTVSTSVPGVKPGDNATYVFASFSFQTSNATAFPNPFGPSNITPQVAARITAVQGTNVTFITIFSFPNGTSYVTDTRTLDVQTQAFCITQSATQPPFCGLEQNPTDLGLLIAAGLNAPDAVGANPSITLNQSVTRVILGAQRAVNFLNTTTSFTGPGYSASLGTGWAWDQQSGIAVGEVGSQSVTSPLGSESLSFSIALVGTNVWMGLPKDFGMISNPPTVVSKGGGPGSSTITLTSLNGFAGTVTLQASTSSPQLSCSLSQTSVTIGQSGNSSLTISCAGSQGTYTVTVIAAAGNLTHTTTLTYTVLHGHRAHIL